MRAARIATTLIHGTALVAFALLAAAPAGAQSLGDRQLLRTTSGNPYLMILFDNSASMNWASTCTTSDIAAGKCTFQCDDQNCPVVRSGDDPNSKLYQAKQALYEVMSDFDGINYGFTTMNQDNLMARAKHWVYQVTAVSGDNTVQMPAVGWQEVFGPQTGGSGTTAFDMRCDRSGPTTDDNNKTLYETGCYMNNKDAPAATTTDTWTLNKLKQLPKGGSDGTTTTQYFVVGTTGSKPYYRVQYLGLGSAISYATTASFTMTVSIQSCATNKVNSSDDTACDSWGTAVTRTVTYTKVGPFFFWEGKIRENNKSTDHTREAAFGGQVDGLDEDTSSSRGTSDASDAYTANSCRGWEPNGPYTGQSGTITEVDPYPDSSGYDLRQSTDSSLVFDPPGTQYDSLFTRGDIIPLDWNDDNKQRVLERLNPGNGYGQADYFADSYSGSETFLRLANSNRKPLIGIGSSPLAGWFSMFRQWYSGCGDPGNCDGTGWSDIAAQYDPNWNCRKKYVLMITDGGESCDGSPQEPAEDYYQDNISEFPDGFSKTADQCRYRASLKSQEDIETLVIGFGTENKAKLQCSNTPVVYVYNKEDLKTEIEKFLGKIKEEAAAFASAAVPTVQANIIDKIYLSSFVPLNDSAVWPGHLDTFLKPLPLKKDGSGLPDTNEKCVPFATDQTQSGCWAWDGGDSQPAWYGEAGYDPQALLLQSPLGTAMTRYDNATLQIGTDVDERRVFFGVPGSALLGQRQYFRYPTDNAEQANFEYVWEMTPIGTGDSGNKKDIAEVIEFTLGHKQGLIDNLDDPANPFHVEYVMGDIFHSNPAVVNPPADFDLFTKDLYWNTPLCDQTLAETQSRGAKISYSYFSNKNICRRVMIFAGSDDGQLHAFDAGQIRTLTDPASQVDCLLNVPTGSSSFLADLKDGNGLGGGYDFGTGREIFSFISDAMMPLTKTLSEISELTTEYGVDGTVRIADVFVDPVLTAGDATCTDREWRSMLLGTYREGGPGIFALDITQPDTIDSASNVPQPASGSPAYVPSCTEAPGGSLPSNCGPLPFPALRWEFTDPDVNGVAGTDDDANGKSDLAEGWSRPVTGRLRVCIADCDQPDAQLEDRYVAIFGGGLPENPLNNDSESSGNWLYILDIETGKLLYKRGGSGAQAIGNAIVGAVAADITAVDFDGDKYIDTLYFGTTAGYVFKVNLGDGPFELDDDGRIKDPDAEDGKYSPFQIFTTNGKPIYLELTAVWVPKLRANALLFGTGIRQNLWTFNGDTGRFYAIVDNAWTDDDGSGNFDSVMQPACVGCPTPLNESKYQGIDPTSTAAVTNYLFDEGGAYQPGWYFTLLENEKLITEPFSLSGITVFTVFSPLQTEETEGCGFGGESKIFVVNTVSSKGYALAAGATVFTRYMTAPTFTTQPFVESSATKNVASDSTANADTWTNELKEINADLKKLFPVGARFANYTLDVKTVRSDTKIYFIAPVPVAIEGHNWKEF